MENFYDNILDPKVNDEEEFSEISLRPQKLSEYIGQKKVKENMNHFQEFD